MLTLYYRPICSYFQQALQEAEHIGIELKLKNISSEEDAVKALNGPVRLNNGVVGAKEGGIRSLHHKGASIMLTCVLLSIICRRSVQVIDIFTRRTRKISDEPFRSTFFLCANLKKEP